MRSAKGELALSLNNGLSWIAGGPKKQARMGGLLAITLRMLQ
jgi:hypothetical protein